MNFAERLHAESISPRSGNIASRGVKAIAAWERDETSVAPDGTQIGEGWKRNEDEADGKQIGEGWKRDEEEADGKQIGEGWKRDEKEADGTQIGEGW